MTSSVGCVLVLYNPQWELTKVVIESIVSQVDLLIIVDNSPTSNKNNIPNSENIKYIFLNGNKGIAYAQNVGIKYLQRKNIDFIFFLDQDSITPPDLVNQLYDKYSFLKNKGFNIGGIGPRPFNREQGKKYLGSIKKGLPVYSDLTKVTELINSASLIPTQAFNTTGLMDEHLFIDGVDHEWCWRAKLKGDYQFFIDESNLLSHKLGEGDRRFLWKKVAIPTPFRTYYQFRNYFILSRRNYVPTYWKISNGVKYLVKLFYFPLFISPRLQYASKISRGIIDGFKFIVS